MKKKVTVGVVATIVVVVIVALIVFVIFGEDKSKPIDLSGVWKIAVVVTDGTVDIPENEYMVLDANEAKDYRNGENKPYAASAYKVNGDVLELSDVSRTYHIVAHTESCISLYTSEKTFMTIVKAESENILNTPFDYSTVSGKWNVVYRPTDAQINNEYLLFNEGILLDYRDNSATPTVTAEYQWNENVIQVPSLKIEMKGFIVASNRLVLVDITKGYVWELTKAEN